MAALRTKLLGSCGGEHPRAWGWKDDDEVRSFVSRIGRAICIR
jgi:hypothetical protein